MRLLLPGLGLIGACTVLWRPGGAMLRLAHGGADAPYTGELPGARACRDVVTGLRYAA